MAENVVITPDTLGGSVTVADQTFKSGDTTGLIRTKIIDRDKESKIGADAIIDVLQTNAGGKPVNVRMTIMGNEGSVIRETIVDGKTTTDYPEIDGKQLLQQIRKDLSDMVFDAKEAEGVASKVTNGVASKTAKLER